MVTHDSDLLALHSAGYEHSGIVFCPIDDRSMGGLIRHLCLIHDCLTPEEMAGEVEFA